MNESATAEDYVNPYNFTQITHGQFLNTSTTNTTFVYRPATMMTPWPYLATSMGLDLVLAIYTCYSNSDKFPSDPRSLVSRLGDLLSILISTIRSWTSFIRAVKGLLDRDSSFMPPTALATLVICMVPTVIRPRGILFYIIALNMLLAYAAFEMTFFRRWNGATHKNNTEFDNLQDYYAGIYISQGNCPSLGCPDTTEWIGCNSTFFTEEYKLQQWKEILKDFGPSKVASAELLLSAFYSFSLLAVAACIPIALWYCLGCSRHRGKHYWRLISDKDYDDPNYRERRNLWAFYTCIAIFVTGIIIVPIHVDQQINQKTIKVWDSNGPFIESHWHQANFSYPEVGTLRSNGSWSDCFEAPLVSDRKGFLEFWWESKKSRPLEWIGVI